MGFLVFLRKSRFSMKSQFRLDCGAQKTKNRRCRGRGLDPFFLSFLLIFYLFFRPFLKGFWTPSWAILDPWERDKKQPRARKKGRKKAWNFRGASEGFLGGSWKDFGVILSPRDPLKWASRVHETLILRKSRFSVKRRCGRAFGRILEPPGSPWGLPWAPEIAEKEV